MVTRNENNNGSWIPTAFRVEYLFITVIVLGFFFMRHTYKNINYGETDQPSFGDNKSFGLSVWGSLFLNAKLYKTQRARTAMELDVVVRYSMFLILHGSDYSCCVFLQRMLDKFE